MTLWDSIILGIVEGVTEYLPVSSTGHLLVTQRLLGLGKSEVNDAFAICIQGGAIMAVLTLYYPRVRDMILGLMGKNPAGLRFFINVICSFMPAVVIGILCEKHIKHYLFGMWPIAVAWVVGGLGILLYVRHRKQSKDEHKGLELEQLTPIKAVIVGLCQCVAMWPGTSRSLMTMLGGMFVGLRLPAAIEFSFLLGLVTLSAATLKDAYEFGPVMLQEFGWLTLGVGTVAAWLSAWLAVKWMVAYLQNHSFAVFGWYRLVIGIALGLVLWFGA